MNIVSSAPVTQASADAVRDSPEKIHNATSQFEALLIGQILRTSQTEEGWLGSADDKAAGSAVDFATDFLAQALASQGGLGLARMMDQTLANRPLSSSNPESGSPALPDTPTRVRTKAAPANPAGLPGTRD